MNPGGGTPVPGPPNPAMAEGDDFDPSSDCILLVKACCCCGSRNGLFKKGLKLGSAPKGEANGEDEEDGEGAPNESSGSASFKSSTVGAVVVVVVLDPEGGTAVWVEDDEGWRVILGAAAANLSVSSSLVATRVYIISKKKSLSNKAIESSPRSPLNISNRTGLRSSSLFLIR